MDNITIDEKTQGLVRGIRIEMLRLQNRLNDILITVYNISGKEGDYQPNKDFTELELVNATRTDE